jgi:hypothetical protein
MLEVLGDGGFWCYQFSCTSLRSVRFATTRKPLHVNRVSTVTGILSLFDESKRESQRTFTLTCLTLTAAVSSILAASVCLRLYLYRRQALAQMTENLKRRGPVRAAWDRAYDTTAILVESSALNTAFSVIFVGLFASGHESTRIAFPIFGQIQASFNTF